LTPFPSLTYRTIGGILDIYIFTGPTPVKALEQAQQVIIEKIISNFEI
jgi:lysosomal alpha-glucosidase